MKTPNLFQLSVSLLCGMCAWQIQASVSQDIDADCVVEKVATLDGQTTIDEIRALCRAQQHQTKATKAEDDSLIAKRILHNRTQKDNRNVPVSYTHLRAHETKANLVCRLLLEKKKTKTLLSY